MTELLEINRDITTVNRGIIIHGCNCQGVMGSGVAKALRDKWPKIYRPYSRMVENYGNRRNLLGLSAIAKIHKDLFVYNAFTQEFYGRDGAVYADINAIRQAVKHAVLMASIFSMRYVWMPPIGCGLGGLDYKTDLKPVLDDIVSFKTRRKVSLVVCDIC